MAQYVLIPSSQSLPLQNLTYENDSGGGASYAGDQLPSYLATVAKSYGIVDKVEFEIVPLRRMSDDTPGVYAYFRRIYNNSYKSKEPNTRATCLLMSCGQYSKRFYGDVYIGRYGRESVGESRGVVRNMDMSVDEIRWGCTSPDLRMDILRNLGGSNDRVTLPNWLVDASKESYIDSIQISALASAFDAKNNTSAGDSSSSDGASKGEEADDNDDSSDDASDDGLRNVTLCLHCRGPSETLCKGCKGAYFCNDPRPCKNSGWSHQCLCKTWRIYVQNRDELSTFPLGDWYKKLIGRSCQVSDVPYRRYLINELKVLEVAGWSWWDTEVDGWAGGLSGSARAVDASVRRSYEEGFLLDSSLIPPERRVSDEDCSVSGINRDARGLPILNSWEDYYTLRNIPLPSPVALLCTFPLTIFYALQNYGEVPITVAKMLGRKLRIHAVGIEKEMNFLDLFKELAYLLPLDLEIELTFIVRADMLPPKCRDTKGDNGYDMKVALTTNLTLMVKSGTYGGEELDPLFGDVGSGPPDMLIGLNAGLFAYSSWSSVVTFCHHNPNVVAVFTDYNEHSGVNCASLGGGKARESLSINPFRQPLAMPVYCMNLPQFSNGFVYVFNKQELDE